MLKLVVVKLSSVVWLVFWSFYLSQDDVQFISPSIIQSDKWGLPVLSSVSFFKVNMDPNLVVLLLYWIRIAYGLILFVMSEVFLMLCNTALDLPGTSGIFFKANFSFKRFVLYGAWPFYLMTSLRGITKMCTVCIYDLLNLLYNDILLHVRMYL